MSINTDITDHFTNGELVSVSRSDFEYHGEKAVRVTAHLSNNKVVMGVFTTQTKSGFGGVEFSGPKDISGLMISKIESVLRGTAE